MNVMYNDDNDNLWCIECKKRIHLGEKYIVIVEDCLGEKIKKTYHCPCVPEGEDDE